MLNKFVLIMVSIMALRLTSLMKIIKGDAIKNLLFALRAVLSFLFFQEIFVNFTSYNLSIVSGAIAGLLVLALWYIKANEILLDIALFGAILISIPVLKFINGIHSLNEISAYLNSITLLRSGSVFKVTVIMLSYYFVFSVAPKIISAIMNQLSPATSSESNETIDKSGILRAGLWIGRLERIIILTLVLIKKEEIISWVVAVKGLLRFGEIQTLKVENVKDADLKMWETIKNKIRVEVEYVIIGTLASLAIVVIVGVIARIVLKI